MHSHIHINVECLPWGKTIYQSPSIERPSAKSKENPEKLLIIGQQAKDKSQLLPEAMYLAHTETGNPFSPQCLGLVL